MPSVIGQDSTSSGFDPGLAAPPLTFGVWGDSATGSGVVGSSSRSAAGEVREEPGGAGVEGVNDARGGLGMRGQADDASGVGVLGTSALGTGVLGRNRAGGVGVEGTSPGGTGVSGRSSSAGVGVAGDSESGTGVSGSSRGGIGVVGRSGQGGGFGVGFAANQAPAVMGTSNTGTGVLGGSAHGNGLEGFSLFGVGVSAQGATLAGDFQGDVRVSGTLTKGGGGFRIDHPLDPANRYLTHSFVESSEMRNLYDGVAVLDADGVATVELPVWFEELNESFRYQLTAIGGPAPDLHVSRPVESNRFTIAGGAPGMEVSWQVTGARRDPWARAHALSVEEDKAAEQQGRFLHPQELGQPVESGLAPLNPGRAAHPGGSTQEEDALDASTR